MNRWIFSLVAGLLLSLVISLPAQAATDKEALKCGLAIRKFQAKGVILFVSAYARLCKHPEELSDVAAKITAKLNKAITRINAKFSAANCDPDLDQIGGLPAALGDQATIEATLAGGNFALDTLCNNVDDHP